MVGCTTELTETTKLEVEGHNVTVGIELVEYVSVKVPAPEAEGLKTVPLTPGPAQTPNELVGIGLKLMVGFVIHCGMIELVSVDGIYCSTFTIIESFLIQPLFEAVT